MADFLILSVNPLFTRKVSVLLQRQLNRDVLKRKGEFKYLETFNETKKLRTENTNHSELVNYVSFAHPIT